MDCSDPGIAWYGCGTATGSTRRRAAGHQQERSSEGVAVPVVGRHAVWRRGRSSRGDAGNLVGAAVGVVLEDSRSDEVDAGRLPLGGRTEKLRGGSVLGCGFSSQIVAGKSSSRSAEKAAGVSMRSAARHWFTEEARQAGWLSAAACVIVASACLRIASAARGGESVVLVYLLLPVGLGCVAVGALNFRRWHSFRESMNACLAAVVNTYRLLGTLALIVLAFSLLLGPLFLYLLAVLIYASIYLAFYISASFLIAMVLAWAAGAVLYGLLWLMRYAGELGRGDSASKQESPRVLRAVV